MEEINLEKVSKILESKMLLIGSNVRMLRKKAGITQQSLAFYILTDKCVISNLERGNCRNITLNTLVKVSDVLGIDVSVLLLP